jgi:hypothetical protein
VVKKLIYDLFLINLGLKATKKNFDGSYQQLQNEFLKHLEIFIESLFSPENLTIKKVFGHDVKGEEFKNLLLDYFDTFNSTETPKAESLYRVTAMREMRKVMDNLKTDYTDEFQKIVNYELTFDEFNDELIKNHDKIKNKIIKNFQSSSKIDDKSLIDEMIEVLSQELDNFSTKLFITVKSIFKDFQVKRKEIEGLKLKNNDIKKRINEERKIYAEQLVEHAKELAKLEKIKREADEKAKRFDVMNFITGIVEGLVAVGKVISKIMG